MKGGALCKRPVPCEGAPGMAFVTTEHPLALMCCLREPLPGFRALAKRPS